MQNNIIEAYFLAIKKRGKNVEKYAINTPLNLG
jgi:hypothetical protein